jgi:hypothetical protein
MPNPKKPKGRRARTPSALRRPSGSVRRSPARSKGLSGANAFRAQTPELIHAALTRPVREVVPEEKVAAVRHWLSAGLLLPPASTRRKAPLHNAMEVRAGSAAVWNHYRRVEDEWKKVALATLPRDHTRKAAREALERAVVRLHAVLRRAFPDMPTRDRERLAATTTRPEEWISERPSQVRAAVLGAYVGRKFGVAVGASRVRGLAAEGRKALRGWQPYLDWIAERGDPKLTEEMTALVELLEWYRGWIAQPLPTDYYKVFGPLFLDLIRTMKAAPPDHPNAAAVGAWLESPLESLPPADTEVPSDLRGRPLARHLMNLLRESWRPDPPARPAE